MSALLSLLAVVMAAYAVHVGFAARAHAQDAARYAAEAAEIAELALTSHGIPRDGRHLRRVASGRADTPSPWTPPNG